MSLRLEAKAKFAQVSAKVLSVDLHPLEPWILSSLDSGHISIWNYNLEALLQFLKVSKQPVRSAKFLPRKNWIIVAADYVRINVYSYLTWEKVKDVEAHGDEITSIAVHSTRPFVVSSSADLSMRLWSLDEGWREVQRFKGHTDRVMQLSFNPIDDNSFASASLDCTIKVWTLNSPDPMFTIDSYDEGVNCVDYFVGDNRTYLIGSSGSTVKIWDLRERSCVHILQSGTPQVSVACYHPDLPLLITGSEDGTIQLWHSTLYRLEKTIKYGLQGVSALGSVKGKQMIAAGYDEGTIVLEIKREVPVSNMDANGNIVWENNRIQLVNVNSVISRPEILDGEVLPLSVKEPGHCDILYPESLRHTPDGRSVVVCGDGRYIVYTTNPWKMKFSGVALLFVCSFGMEFAAMNRTMEVIILNKQFQERKKIDLPRFSVTSIFGGTYLAVCTTDFVCFYDWGNGRLIHRINVKVRDIYWTHRAGLAAIISESSFQIVKFSKDSIASSVKDGKAASNDVIQDSVEFLHIVNERVRTGCWVGDNFIYINSSWRLNFCSGGEVTTMYHLDRPMYHLERPMHVLGYVESQNKVYLIDNDFNVVGFTLALRLLQYKTLVMRHDFKAANDILASIPKAQYNSLAHFLEAQGMVKDADEIATDPDYKFRLAAQLGNLEVEKIGHSEIFTRIATGEDFEFSWKDNLFRGKYILPAVRNQGRTRTCVFQSLCAAADVHAMRSAALERPSRTSDIHFSASAFVADYEALSGPIPHDKHSRLPKALELFKDQGVYAEGGGAPPQRYKMAASHTVNSSNPEECFRQVIGLLSDGKPVIGTFKVDASYKTLKPDDIYDYDHDRRRINPRGKTFTHCVVFIGLGQRNDRLYLVFMDSNGTGSGDKGFRRVYLEHVRDLTTLEF